MYHDDTVPRVILASLALMPHVRLVNMSAEIKFLPNPYPGGFSLHRTRALVGGSSATSIQDCSPVILRPQSTSG